MSFVSNPHTLAEMFADMIDVFSETVDHDGLSTLLDYCLDASGLDDGLVAILGEGHQLDTVVGLRGRVDSSTHPLPATAVRALRSLHTELAISGDMNIMRHDYAFPLRVRGSALGVIHLSGTDGRSLTEADMTLLQSIADTVATAIDQTHRLHQAQSLVAQLQGALDSRVVIEQAKGILAAQRQTDVARAFSEIRSTARREQRPVRSVASEIVSAFSQPTTASTTQSRKQ